MLQKTHLPSRTRIGPSTRSRSILPRRARPRRQPSRVPLPRPLLARLHLPSPRRASHSAQHRARSANAPLLRYLLMSLQGPPAQSAIRAQSAHPAQTALRQLRAPSQRGLTPIMVPLAWDVDTPTVVSSTGKCQAQSHETFSTEQTHLHDNTNGLITHKGQGR